MSEPLAEDALDWLPDALREPARRHFRAGRRVPQELVGTEALATEGETADG